MIENEHRNFLAFERWNKMTDKEISQNHDRLLNQIEHAQGVSKHAADSLMDILRIFESYMKERSERKNITRNT